MGYPDFWEDGLAVVNYSGFKPTPHQVLYRADGVELVQDGVVGIDNPLPSRIPAPQPALSKAEGSACPYHYSMALASA